MFIDTHLHLVDRERITYPWLSDVPDLDRDWSYEEYERSARRIGISGVLHMEVDCAATDIEAETDFVAQLMARPDSLMRGAIASGRPEEAGFAAYIERIDPAVVKGIRRVLHVIPDDMSQSDLFRENIRRLADLDLPFDICMEQRQLPLAAELVDACPDTRFVIDHCGVPDIAKGNRADWAAAISRLAERPNTNIKISGITAYTGENWTLGTLRPYVHHAIEAFGWDRVVWGSDSPVCTLRSSLDQWMAITQALLTEASSEERFALAQGNANRIYRLT